MTYRYSEEELRVIKARQDANLAAFQRNSGRGLPVETVEAMERAKGVQMDDNGEPIPAPLATPVLPKKKAKARKSERLPVPTEFQECCWLIEWAETQRFQGWKVSDILVLVPNGAYHGRNRKAGAVVARKLREQGLRAGVFDYILPVPLWTKKCPGLWLEMKRTKGGHVSEDQDEFHRRMLQLSWRCEVARGWEEAAKIITQYLRSATPR